MLKLREILWEITPKCHKNCEYCGSKDIKDKEPLSDSDLIHIAEQIADYGVEEVTLTGGEPGTLAKTKTITMDKIVNILHDGGVKLKAVTNGELLDVVVPTSDIYDKFDVFGISVNTTEDIENIRDKYKEDIEFNTMITNFGKHNIWDFDKLANCASGSNCWQIQLTMGDEMLSPDGIKYLRDKVRECQVSATIVLADNLQATHICSAGVSGCSITYSGDVVACLSERSYGGIQKVYGNLLTDKLENIWENEFKDIRFKGCRKCCREFIEYPEDDGLHLPTIIKDNNPPVDAGPAVVLYAVINPTTNNPHRPWGGGGNVMVYGAFNP